MTIYKIEKIEQGVATVSWNQSIVDLETKIGMSVWNKGLIVDHIEHCPEITEVTNMPFLLNWLKNRYLGEDFEVTKNSLLSKEHELYGTFSLYKGEEEWRGIVATCKFERGELNKSIKFLDGVKYIAIYIFNNSNYFTFHIDKNTVIDIAYAQHTLTINDIE
jgi:hypothetical protein